MTNISIARLVPETKNLIYRGELVPVREKILSSILELPSNTVVYYDFSGIKAINHSGCDELIAKVMQELVELDSPKFLVVTNLSVDYEHSIEIDLALTRREIAVVHEVDRNKAEFLGKVTEAHREILQYVYENKRVTAREVADALNKKINLISTHLLTLFKTRLVRREEDLLSEGGRQYVYSSLI